MYSNALQPDYQTAIVGAGFSGIIAALGLRKSGRSSFVIFEKAAKPGGTWRDNTYPGCACDIPSNLYSITSEPNPDWSRRFSTQPEIWAYLNRTIDQNDLARHIRYHTKIVRYEFLEECGYWRLTDHRGDSVTARMVVMAVGAFKSPKLPNIGGFDVFDGKIMHSAQWDHSYSLEGKRVAIVGTGASAAQIVPAIAPKVAKLTVYQRTPAWVSDRFDRRTPIFWKKVFRYAPWVQRLARGFWFELLELRGRLFFGNEWLHNFLKKQLLEKLENEVADSVVRNKLTPDYHIGCKRIVVSDHYLPAFNRANVTLETDPIDTLTSSCIRTKGGTERAFDAVIFATGYEVTRFDPDIKVFGRGGRDLIDEWNCEGLEAHRGTFCEGFPNFCTLLGPNTGLGHNSVLLMVETQVDYMLQFLTHLERQAPQMWMEPRPEAQRAYNAEIQRKLQNTSWAAGCNSWYIDARGKNTTIYPGLVRDFKRALRRFDPDEYAVVKAPALVMASFHF